MRVCPAEFSPAKNLRTCVYDLAGPRRVASGVRRDGMDRSAGSDGDLPDLALTEEIESKSKSKSKIRQSFQGLIQCQWGRGEGNSACELKCPSPRPSPHAVYSQCASRMGRGRVGLRRGLGWGLRLTRRSHG
jgi:hypothetical protein